MRNICLTDTITENFSFGELIRSDTALKLNIDNTPPNDRIWKNLELLTINCLQLIRDRFGALRVTSGYRSPELCVAIGSSINSNHTRGQSADIKPCNSKIKLIDILNYIYINISFRELILEYPPRGWIHVTYREGGNTNTLKLKDKKHNYTRVTIDYVNELYNK